MMLSANNRRTPGPNRRESDNGALLRCRDLHVWYPVREGVFNRLRGHVKAVNGLDLEIHDGEVLGLVGESGCGKSTLARAILRLEQITSGGIFFAGEDISGLGGRALRQYRRQAQAVFQNPFDSLNPRHSIRDIVTEGLLVHGLAGEAERDQAALSLLQDVGLDRDVLYRYPHAFSGGQRQRVAIARALALNPRLIVCDEAVSALDVSIRAQILNLMGDLQKKRHLAYLFITHDLSVVQYLADRVAVMYKGLIVETGKTTSVIERPAHPYTRLLWETAPRIGKPLPDIPSRSGTEEITAVNGCPFAPRCPLRDGQCLSEVPPMAAAGRSGDECHLAACFHAE